MKRKFSPTAIGLLRAIGATTQGLTFAQCVELDLHPKKERTRVGLEGLRDRGAVESVRCSDNMRRWQITHIGQKILNPAPAPRPRPKEPPITLTVATPRRVFWVSTYTPNPTPTAMRAGSDRAFQLPSRRGGQLLYPQGGQP